MISKCHCCLVFRFIPLIMQWCVSVNIQWAHVIAVQYTAQVAYGSLYHCGQYKKPCLPLCESETKCLAFFIWTTKKEKETRNEDKETLQVTSLRDEDKERDIETEERKYCAVRQNRSSSKTLKTLRRDRMPWPWSKVTWHRDNAFSDQWANDSILHQI